MAIITEPRLMCDCTSLFVGEQAHAGHETVEIGTSTGTYELELCPHMLAWVEDVGRYQRKIKVSQSSKRPKTKTHIAKARARQSKGGGSPRHSRSDRVGANLTNVASSRGFSPPEIRSWCKKNSIPVNAMGRIPSNIIDRYEIAMTNGSVK